MFEVADTGSIFLDEIGDLRPETQVRLLRVLQEREFTPVGDTTPVKVDVRIIAATNVDLKEAVRNGQFREDLYYRLSVVPLELPPLRERREDILPLTQHFIRKYSEENGREISETVSPDVLSLLEAYNYPGNVRELENIIERAIVIAPSDEITVECLRPEVRDPELAFQMIVDTGGTVSLSVPVEMQMGHGMPPTQRFLDRGLRPSLSVDVETNVPSDFFTQMRSAISLQRVLLFERLLAGEQNLPPFLTSRDVIEFATIEGARANGLDHKIGTLTPGKEADVIMLRTDLVNVFPVNDPIGAVVWGMDTSNVDSVFVAGKALKRNGQLLGVDMNRIRTMTYASRDHVVAASNFKLPSL